MKNGCSHASTNLKVLLLHPWQYLQPKLQAQKLLGAIRKTTSRKVPLLSGVLKVAAVVHQRKAVANLLQQQLFSARKMLVWLIRPWRTEQALQRVDVALRRIKEVPVDVIRAPAPVVVAVLVLQALLEVLEVLPRARAGALLHVPGLQAIRGFPALLASYSLGFLPKLACRAPLCQPIAAWHFRSCIELLALRGPPVLD